MVWIFFFVIGVLMVVVPAISTKYGDFQDFFCTVRSIRHSLEELRSSFLDFRQNDMSKALTRLSAIDRRQQKANAGDLLDAFRDFRQKDLPELLARLAAIDSQHQLVYIPYNKPYPINIFKNHENDDELCICAEVGLVCYCTRTSRGDGISVLNTDSYPVFCYDDGFDGYGHETLIYPETVRETEPVCVYVGDTVDVCKLCDFAKTFIDQCIRADSRWTSDYSAFSILYVLDKLFNYYHCVPAKLPIEEDTLFIPIRMSSYESHDSTDDADAPEKCFESDRHNLYFHFMSEDIETTVGPALRSLINRYNSLFMQCPVKIRFRQLLYPWDDAAETITRTGDTCQSYLDKVNAWLDDADARRQFVAESNQINN